MQKDSGRGDEETRDPPDASSHVQRVPTFHSNVRPLLAWLSCFKTFASTSTADNPLLDMDGDDQNASQAKGTPPTEYALSSLFSGILAPGSSLNPTFLLALDGVLAILLLVLLGLFVVTNYNFHLLFLSIVELCLWASIKW